MSAPAKSLIFGFRTAPAVPFQEFLDSLLSQEPVMADLYPLELTTDQESSDIAGGDTADPGGLAD